MTVSLTPDLEQYVREKIEAGQFENESGVVQGALEVLRDQERLTPGDIEHLRRLVQPAIDELDRGEGIEWDTEALKRRIHDRLKRRGDAVRGGDRA